MSSAPFLPECASRLLNQTVNKIKVTAVSYLNTKPLLYGIFKSPIAEKIDLQLDIPSVCAAKLRDGRADLGLVPVAVIPELPAPRILSDYCIGTVGTVRTVAVFAERPLEELTHLYLDHHSRTSVELVQILLRDYWNLSLALLPAADGYIDSINDSTGGLVIGDRTIGLHQRFPFVYDLGEAWMKHTGLPFVFAAWISNHAIDPDFLIEFNLALQQGLQHIPQLMYLLPTPQPGFDLEEYFTHFISYEFDAAKKRALSLFLQKMGYRPQPELLESLAVV